MEDLISVIVPIYNIQNYIEKCVGSICSQTYQNLQMILVDDGSTDESGAICDKLAKDDDRITVIHKPNGGLTSARKAGIKDALGKYIGFVDGDDWIEPDMYESMHDKITSTNSDIVLTDMYRETFTGELITWNYDLTEGIYERDVNFDEVIKHLFSGISDDHSGINGGVPVKLFRSTLLRECVFAVPDELTGFADDKAIVYPAILKARRIYVMNQAFYHGVDRKGSATHSVVDHFFVKLQLAYDYFCEVFQKENESDRELLMEQLNYFLANSAMSHINAVSMSPIIPEWKLPYFEKLPAKSRIILFGKGKVGQAYYKEIKSTGYYDIVAWIDKNNLEDLNTIHAVESKS